MLRRFFALSALSLLPVFAQIVVINARWPVPPIVRPVPIRADCRIESVDVRADIQDQAAKVRVSQVFRNPSPVPMEAQVLFPLPEGAAVGGDSDGDGDGTGGGGPGQPRQQHVRSGGVRLTLSSVRNEV